MFYNGKNSNVSKKILEYINSIIDIDSVSSSVLIFYLDENIKSFIGDAHVDPRDLSFVKEQFDFLITTIYDCKIRVRVSAASDFLLKIEGECLDSNNKVIETFLITKCGEKIINNCSCDNGVYSYSYFVDTAAKMFTLSKENKITSLKEFIIKATPLGSSLDDSYLYALERVYPKPDLDNGSVLKKFVDLVRNDSLLNLPEKSTNELDIIVLNEIFSHLKQEILEKKKREKKVV